VANAFKKSVHIGLDPEIHEGLLALAFENNLSMSSILSHLGFLLVEGDWYLHERINEFKHQEREKKVYPFSGIDSNSLFDLIENSNDEEN